MKQYKVMGLDPDSYADEPAFIVVMDDEDHPCLTPSQWEGVKSGWRVLAANGWEYALAY